MANNVLIADINTHHTHSVHHQNLSKIWQQAMYQLLNHNVFGVYWDLGQALLAFTGFAFYCAEMYLTTPMPTWMLIVESVLALMYACDLVFYFIAAERKLQFVTSWQTIVDVLSILPVVTLSVLYAGIVGPTLQFLRILRLFRAFRLLDISAPGGLSDATIMRQAALLLCTVSTYVLTGAGMVHAFDRQWPGSFTTVSLDSVCDFGALANIPAYERPSNCSLDLIGAVYFSLITSLTVGFGDIVPRTSPARILTLGILLPLFLLVPAEASRLLSLLELSSRYNKRFSGSAYGFCVVCGEFTASKMLSMLEEFYHEDHGEQHMRIVFLHPSEPDASKKAVLSDIRFAQKIQYVRGTALSSQDLQRVEYFQAHAVFVLSSDEGDAEQADDLALLTVKSLKSTAPWVPVHLTLQLPSSAVHRWADWDHLVCAQEMLGGLLAKSAAVPGLCTLVGNLLQSCSDTTRRELNSLDSADRVWMKEYVRGMENELYCVELSTAFNRQFFNCVAHQAFVMFGVIILGVETKKSLYKVTGQTAETATAPSELQIRALEEHQAVNLGLVSESSTPGAAPAALLDQEDSPEERYHRLQAAKAVKEDLLVLLNPRDYLIRAGDKAFVIASDMETAQQISNYSGVPPAAVADLAGITTADKRTFHRLNGGTGPLIQFASLGVAQAVSAGDDAPGDAGEAPPYASSDDGRDAAPLLESARSTGDASRSAGDAPAPAIPPVPLSSLDPFSGVASAAVDPESAEEQALYGSRVIKTAKWLTGHLVVCGPGVVSRLRELAVPLASSSSSHIVVLYPFSGSDDDEVATLSELDLAPDMLRRIFLLNGSSASQRDLVRAGIATAACAIILPSTGTSGDSEGLQRGLSAGASSSVVDTQDIESLFTACVIESNFPHTRILVEVPSAGSLRYLSFRPYLADSLPGALWPQIASGRVFVSTVLSVLQVDLFYMPSLTTLIGKLIDPSRSLSSGTQAAPPAANTSLAVAYAARFPLTTPCDEAMAAEELARRFPEHNHMHHMVVPEPFVGKRFGDLFVELILSRSILCIGVYRSPLVHSAPLPYVVTNPSPKMRLHRDDRLYVLVGPTGGVKW